MRCRLITVVGQKGCGRAIEPCFGRFHGCDNISNAGLAFLSSRSQAIHVLVGLEKQTIPMKTAISGKWAATTCLAAWLMAGCSHAETKAADAPDRKSAASVHHADTKIAGSWDAKAAAAYLDQREAAWMGWPAAARDHQTFCISCHTAVPYALSRPVLRKALDEQTLSANERLLLNNVTKRVRLWKEVAPFYGDEEYGAHKATESRATEAVLNALVLASYDAQNGKLSADTRTAFSHMWELQQTSGDGKGAWSWQQFNLKPWEARDSPYYGAVLAAMAVRTAPENYPSTPEIQNNLKMLREYLVRGYPTQSSINRVELLWVSTKWPGLLGPEQQKSIIDEILGKQRPDGGWCLASLATTWRDWSLSSFLREWKTGAPEGEKSDGYATGLIILALKRAGLPRENAQLQQGLSWLVRNQNRTEGLWPGYSLNRRRDPSSITGHFMSDAATAYAVLALTETDLH